MKLAISIGPTGPTWHLAPWPVIEEVRQWHAAAGTAALVALQRRSARRGTAVSTSPIFEGSKGEEPIKAPGEELEQGYTANL